MFNLQSIKIINYLSAQRWLIEVPIKIFFDFCIRCVLTFDVPWRDRGDAYETTSWNRSLNFFRKSNSSQNSQTVLGQGQYKYVHRGFEPLKKASGSGDLLKEKLRKYSGWTVRFSKKSGFTFTLWTYETEQATKYDLDFSKPTNPWRWHNRTLLKALYLSLVNTTQRSWKELVTDSVTSDLKFGEKARSLRGNRNNSITVK